MRHVRTLGACLIALMAITALTATAASAKSTLPEWGQCEPAPTHEGLYGNANCTDPVKPLFGKPAGEYEWYGAEQPNPEFPRGENEPDESLIEYHYKFGGGQIGPATFEATTGQVIQCSDTEEGFSGSAGVDELKIEGGKKVGDILVSFTGCESEGEQCHSEFSELGEFTDVQEWSEGEGFKGELVPVSGKGTGSPTVGLTLQPFRKPGETYLNQVGEPVTSNGALFTVVCEGSLGSLRIGGAGGKKEEKAKGNAAVAVIAPVDQMTREYTETFAQAAGVQEPAPEKGKAKSLQMYIGNENKWVQMGMATTWPLLAESRRHLVEIKAVK